MQGMEAEAAAVAGGRTDVPRSQLKGGRYVIPWEGFFMPGVRTLMRFLCSKSESSIPSQEELDKTLPVVDPDKEKLANPPPGAVQATWLGHATVLVQMEGLNILTDPIFSDYCGPVSMKPVPKRYRRVPLRVADLPEIHAVVISHNHYDHLDYPSIQQLNQQFGNSLTWFVPRGLRQWMIDSNCLPENVKDLDWWEEASIVNRSGVRFVFTPAQHWSKRGLLDNNKVLWGSWCIIGQTTKFYFAGDTGYCDIFKTIKQQFGSFDLAAIPIGAYKPREMMRCQHVDPDEAWKIHKDLNASRSLGIHWGTFNLSHEFYMEPKNKINEMEGNRDPPTFVTINPGETMNSPAT